MKKEQKRYFLVEYLGYKKVEYNTKEEVLKALDDTRKYNNRKSSRCIAGNITCEYVNGKYIFIGHYYRKLREKSTISELDNYTSIFDEKGLIKELYPRLVTANPDNNKEGNYIYPDINIAFFEEKDFNKKTKDDNIIRRIKYIPVLYKNDNKFLNEEFIRNCIKSKCYSKYIDYDFFYGILEEFKYFRNTDQEYDELRMAINRVRYGDWGAANLYSATMNFYKSLIVERERDGSIVKLCDGSDQISRRRLRDFGFYVKNYKSSLTISNVAHNYVNKTKLEEMKRIRNEIINSQDEQLSLKLN